MPGPPPTVDGVEHRELDVRGVRLHVAEAGAGDPVLLLHGWPQHWWEWRRVIPLLAGNMRLIAPDHRGFGWSATPGAGYDPGTFAADAAALLDVLGIDRVHVIGHDWGGYTAFVLGLEHPERVRSLTVLSAPHPWVGASPREAREIWRAWYALGIAVPGVGEGIMRRPRGLARLLGVDPSGVLSPEEIEVYAAVLREPARAEASKRLYQSYVRTLAGTVRGGPFKDRRLSVPTHVLLGAEDAFIPAAWVEGVGAHGDDARSELVPGEGHWLPESRPELVAQRARELWARTA